MENNLNKNSSSNNKKNSSNNDVEAFNDQLGENASEEFKSESYDNALQSKNKNKTIK